MCLVTLAAVATAGCGSGSTSGSKTSTSPAASADLTATASAAYAAAFNIMNSAVNADIPKQNKAATDPTGAAAAISDEVSARQTFDSSVSAITFPTADAADVQAVISADAALENALGTLSANTDNIPNYNSIFPTVTTAEGSFTAADAALSGKLGLSNTAP
jgi:hypothetical protein